MPSVRTPATFISDLFSAEELDVQCRLKTLRETPISRVVTQPGQGLCIKCSHLHVKCTPMLECIKPLLHQNLLCNYYNRLCDTRLCYISFRYINFRYIRFRYITFRYINFQVMLYQIPLYQFPIFPILTDQWVKISVISVSVISNSVIAMSFFWLYQIT